MTGRRLDLMVTVTCPECGHRRIGTLKEADPTPYNEHGLVLTYSSEMSPEWTWPKRGRVPPKEAEGATVLLDDDLADEVPIWFDCPKHGCFELTAGDLRQAYSRGHRYIPATPR